MSPCCCCRELLEGSRKKERLLTEEGTGGGGGREEEHSRRNMDISLLREQYRSSREKQQKQTQVLLFRTVSGELSEAVSVIPVAQGLTPLPPVISLDPDPTTYDPWHIHLDLHRRSHTTVPIHLPVFSSETKASLDSSFRHSSCSFSEALSSQEETWSRKRSVDSTPDSFISCKEICPCSSFCNKQENHFNTDRSRGDPDSERYAEDSFSSSNVDSVKIAHRDPLSPPEQRSREDAPGSPFGCSKGDRAYWSFTDSQESSTPGSQASSDESSTPVASVTGSPSSSTSNLHEGLKETWSADTKSSSSALQTSNTPTWRGSRRFSSSANRFTRHLSVGGEGLFTGVQHNQNYYPFPSRKTPRISEAAKRLGMYSSF